MRNVQIILALCLTGCGNTVIPIHTVVDNEEDNLIIEEAAAELGYGVEFHTGEDWNGTVHIDIISKPGRSGLLGLTAERRRCERSFWAVPFKMVVAHELAHALSLEHTGYDTDPEMDHLDDEVNPVNLMAEDMFVLNYPTYQDWEDDHDVYLTDDQHDDMQYSLDTLCQCNLNVCKSGR